MPPKRKRAAAPVNEEKTVKPKASVPKAKMPKTETKPARVKVEALETQTAIEGLTAPVQDRPRCSWLARCIGKRTDTPIARIYTEYHDTEWGAKNRLDDNRYLFEMLVLEGAQAGLSWATILLRREAYREAYSHWDVDAIAGYTPEKLSKLLSGDSGVIRNRAKIESSIANARLFLEIVAEHNGSFREYLDGFIQKADPKEFGPRTAKDGIRATSQLSEDLSADLRARGMRFVGPTCMYAYLQSIGVVDDHDWDCFRHRRFQDKQA
ncbi:DNA-3-methyladenine glycosylase I [Polychytrium aggregatum]|uniref:DNA-3-methyladenine glycosylase I n=1 Tax=Polychytrium aggregatum TaxID=110093 RepID=UPI0022FF44DC|nr:DNA-3-methyladenine glycosylase I [Polychytrium aggregatum]KAI9203028.1 DNA-3-methyladenine glycosylase I [Polychytrium aggregatum]